MLSFLTVQENSWGLDKKNSFVFEDSQSEGISLGQLWYYRFRTENNLAEKATETKAFGKS